jgi:hypothetical protein
MRRPGDKHKRSKLPPGGGAAARAWLAAAQRGIVSDDEGTCSVPGPVKLEQETKAATSAQHKKKTKG